MSLLPSRASSTLESSSAFPNLPLISLTAPEEEEKRRRLTTLPSAPFAHARWCELKNAEIKARYVLSWRNVHVHEMWNNIPDYTQAEINGGGPCEPSLTS